MLSNINKKYYPGRDITIDHSQKSRLRFYNLHGHTIMTLFPHFIYLLPKHIECCFGANGVRVVLLDTRVKVRDVTTTMPLEKWLNSDVCENQKLIGFQGPDGTTLYIIIKKEVTL